MPIAPARIARGIATAAAAIVGLGLAGCGTGTAAGPGASPTANGGSPSGRTIEVSGSGFPANSTVEILECASRTVVAPRRGCSPGNAENVRTSADGTFRARFRVTPCPQLPYGRRGGRVVIVHHCYVGVPVLSGVDVARLTDVVLVTPASHS